MAPFSQSDHRTITSVQLLTRLSINGNTSGPTLAHAPQHRGQEVNRVKEERRREFLQSSSLVDRGFINYLDSIMFILFLIHKILF